MGYTHYIRTSTEIPKENWKAITTCVEKIYEKLGHFIQREWDDDSLPIVNAEEIRFNGIDKAGHETFLIRRTDTDFNFCKTARKNYDLVVCAVLIVVNHYAGEFVKVSSDGTTEDWQEAVDWVAEELKIESTLNLGDEE